MGRDRSGLMSRSAVTTARAVALEALARIDAGAYANLVLDATLERSALSERDRAFVTDLVYGTTRMRRACDFLLEPHIRAELDPDVRAALRLGAFQLLFLRTPPHAAVSATVEAAPRRAKGLVNAVLRKIAGVKPKWPDRATELSYPDWIVDLVVAELGDADGLAALRAMNEPASATRRADGYVQDAASQEVARYVGARVGDLIGDVCGAPGGKATLMAAEAPALVAAGDIRATRAALVAANAATLGSGNVAAFVGDARTPPLRDGSLDRVLVDAPCSGLGVLRRRPDARWRIGAEDVDRLAALQRELLVATMSLLRDGATLVYSVCTMTEAETIAIDEWLEQQYPGLHAIPPPVPPWRQHRRGALLLPHDAGTDGMYVLGLRQDDR